MDEATALVVAPFRDIVDKAKAALDNAGDNEAMRKASQALVREGERALTRIEPLCQKHVDEYSLNFINALKEDETITKFRSELNELLWEFDDYIEADDFDQAKFDELRAASRKAAPQIIEIMTRMKLKSVNKPPSRAGAPMTGKLVTAMTLSPPSSPRSSTSTAVSHSPLLTNPPPLPPPTAPLPPLPRNLTVPGGRKSVIIPDGVVLPSGMPMIHGNLQEWNIPPLRVQRTSSHRQSGSSGSIGGIHADALSDGQPLRGPPPLPPQPAPPMPPSANPWDHRVRPTVDISQLNHNGHVNRRAPVAKPESPANAFHRTSSELEKRAMAPGQYPVMHPASGSGDLSAYDSHEDRRRWATSAAAPTYGLFPPQAPMGRPRAPTLPSPMEPVIPENNVAGSMSNGVSHDPATQLNRSPSSYSHSGYSPKRDSVAMSVGSDLNSSSNYSQEARSSTTTTYDSSRHSNTTKSSNRMSQLVTGLELAVQNEEARGLTSMESERETSVISSSAANTASEAPTRDCPIANTSSFYLMGGFCEGAREIARGGVGTKTMRKPVGISNLSSVARCISCAFEFDSKDTDMDSNRHDRGNFLKCGIYFRIRFLQKVHIATKRNDDVFYGCPFCIQDGHTIDGSDATVFFDVKALFTHLSWHPRPLPQVPGFTIIEAEEVPPEYQNDYDIHFPNPPDPHPVLEEDAARLSQLPTAVAKDSVRKINGQRLLPDRTPALELAAGARVTGITWLEQYNGEWCMAWHNGKHASVPTECLVFEAPREMKMGGLSNWKAKARWKFRPNKDDKGDWLALSKGDTITNINWAYFDHWCWSGTNSKGKWGVFPQAFIDINTMHEAASTPSDGMSVVSNEKKPGGIRGMFSSRSKSSGGKRPSVAESSSSQETTTAAGASRPATANNSPQVIYLSKNGKGWG
jgi:hypothetical protein